jgi:hypothetical protein
MTTIIVGGALANKLHNGGEAWVRLSWVRGLQQLGFRVVFVEQIAHAACVDEAGTAVPFAQSANLSYFRQVTERFDLADSAVLIEEESSQIYGCSYGELVDLVTEAELLINVSGHLRLEPLMQRIRHKVFVDIDPGFTQFWHAAGNPGARLAGHDHYFTIGENIGTDECSIPTSGIPWRPTRQPVVLGDWPVVTTPPPIRFTTVASWRGPFGSIDYGGQTYGLKVHEFRKVIDLPQRTPLPFEIALAIHPADDQDRRALLAHGWTLEDPRTVAVDPIAFRRYVRDSGAEFSVAQGVYVETNSGWFSDRTVRYLASGKPVLVQDTGFDRTLPVGDGLLSFRTLDDAVAGAEEIARNYEHHCRAARALAEEYFDSDMVLGRLVAEIGIAL